VGFIREGKARRHGDQRPEIRDQRSDVEVIHLTSGVLISGVLPSFSVPFALCIRPSLIMHHKIRRYL